MRIYKWIMGKEGYLDTGWAYLSEAMKLRIESRSDFRGWLPGEIEEIEEDNNYRSVPVQSGLEKV